jgi:hypothetical protein
MLDRGVADLTPAQWHAIPADNARANTIAFEMWHYARTEDNIVRFIIQGRRPTVWMEGGWAERLGLPAVAQGTGMSTEEAQSMRIADLDAFKQYVQAVWRARRLPRTPILVFDRRSWSAARRDARDPRLAGLHDPRLHAPGELELAARSSASSPRSACSAPLISR